MTPVADPVLLPALRRRLGETGYTEAEIREVFGLGALEDPWSLTAAQPTRTGSSLWTIASLFYNGVPAERRLAEAALAPLPLADLEAIGLIEVRDETVRPRCLLQPHADLVVASDLPGRHPDLVLGVVPASQTLGHLTVRRRVRRALDLGTGCGIQALLLARHSDAVIAVDVNPRALAFGQFNAMLNGVANVEWRKGSWFAPVAHEQFDVIACNPPYVISPDAAFVYRDGGLPRDAICRTLIREMSDHLQEGAFATILCNWVRDGAWADPVRDWVADIGCDALLLHYGTVDPSTYAARWNRELQASEPRVFESTVRRWIAYYRQERIGGIAMGAVILRRRAGAVNWVAPIDMATGPTTPSSDHVLRLVAGADFLGDLEGAAGVLRHPFAFVDGHRVDQTLEFSAGSYTVGPAVFRCTQGIGVEAQIDARTLDVFLGCDGKRALGEILTEVAARGDEPEASIAARVVPAARRLIECGFMVPIVREHNHQTGEKGDVPC